MAQKQILIVDDLADNLKLLASILEEIGYDVRVAVNGQMALISMEKQVPDLVLLDVRMPGMDGFEVCQQIKNTPHLAHIPVIFISALTKTRDKVKGLQAGGADFITKPFQKEEVLARINTHMKLAELQENLKHSAESLEQEVGVRTRELSQINDQLRKEIAQRTKTEKQLLENERRFRAIFDQAPMGIVLIQAETGKFSKVNPKFTILSGYREDELLKMDIQSIIHPEDLENALNQGILLNKKKIELYGLEQRYVQKDGSIIWVNVTVVPLWGEDALLGQNLAMVEDISERRKTQQSLKASEKSLRNLASKLQETEELFRKQLSRELHDQAGQNLTALNLNLNLLENQLRKGQLDKMQERLTDSIVLVEDTSRTIRDVMADLRPAVLDDYGLRAALRWHCERFSQRYNIQVVMDDIHLDYRLPETVESAFFRICQEAMNNVAKHARADQVWISLNDTMDSLYMSIKDDGIGFDSRLLELTKDRMGWGLLNMTERVQALGGTAEIFSQPGKGTVFSVTIRKSKYEN